MLSQLLYFKVVAECGTISRAAKELHVTGPAISIALSKLENELHANLFERCGNRLVITETGKVFLNRVNQIFEELNTAAIEVKTIEKTAYLDAG